MLRVFTPESGRLLSLTEKTTRCVPDICPFLTDKRLLNPPLYTYEICMMKTFRIQYNDVKNTVN